MRDVADDERERDARPHDEPGYSPIISILVYVLATVSVVVAVGMYKRIVGGAAGGFASDAAEFAVAVGQDPPIALIAAGGISLVTIYLAVKAMSKERANLAAGLFLSLAAGLAASAVGIGVVNLLYVRAKGQGWIW